MFSNYSVFFKNNFSTNTNTNQLSFQKLFKLFKLLNKNSKYTFLHFLIQLGCFNNLGNTSNNKNTLPIFFFYYYKFDSIVRYSNSLTINNKLVYSNNVYNFSKIFKICFKNKKAEILYKYISIGLVVVKNNFITISTKLENSFNNSPVNITYSNGSLLSSPKYSSSSISKYLPLNFVDNMEFQFLRKNKVYNKGRYSRCRQNYRTGVYMCMYLSIVSIFGLYYWFYKFSFNFTYLWWFFLVFVGSFFLPKIVKYRLY